MLKHIQEKKQIENNIFLEVDKKFWQVIEKERSLFFLNKKESKGNQGSENNIFRRTVLAFATNVLMYLSAIPLWW